MTTELGSPTAHKLELDPRSETVQSALWLALVLATGLGVTLLGNAAMTHRPITGEPSLILGFLARVALGLLPTAVLALAVWFRARAPERRRKAVGAVIASMTLGVASQLLFWALVTTENVDTVAIALVPINVAASILLVLGWGWARRRGSLWYVALVSVPVVTLLIDLALSGFATSLITDSEPLPYLLFASVINPLGLLLSGLLAWGIDVAQRR